MDVAVREFKGRLSVYLRRAAAGEDITITSHGRAVARLVPVYPRTNEEPSAAEVRRRLAAIPGIILAKGGKPQGAKNPMRIRKGEKSLAEIVLEDRR
jgi:prevent-host-death family protein